MKIIKVLILTAFLLNACSETIELDYFKRVKIKIKVNSSDAVKFDNSVINIKNNVGWSTSSKTNNDGILEMEVFPGFYSICTESYVKSINYSDCENLLIFSEGSNYIELNPLNNIGTMTLFCRNSKNVPYQDLNVSLLSSNADNFNTFNEFKLLEFKTAKTDQSGKVTFTELPKNNYFRILLYIDETKFYYTRFNGYSLQYGSNYTITFNL